MGSGKSTIMKKMILDLISGYLSENDKKAKQKTPVLVLAKFFKSNFSLFKTIEIDVQYLTGNKIFNLEKLFRKMEK